MRNFQTPRRLNPLPNPASTIARAAKASKPLPDRQFIRRVVPDLLDRRALPRWAEHAKEFAKLELIFDSLISISDAIKTIRLFIAYYEQPLQNLANSEAIKREIEDFCKSAGQTLSSIYGKYPEKRSEIIQLILELDNAIGDSLPFPLSNAIRHDLKETMKKAGCEVKLSIKFI